MRSTPDVAVILLDVVMETDDAGLELVDYIRTQLKNETVRIILRTGQPGQAPERRVIVDYDINDYKAKTELTADKLFTALTAALAQLPAAPAHGRDAPRPRNDHRGRVHALRFQVDATAGGRRADPDRRRCSTSTAAASWCCAKAARRRSASPCSPAPAATATTPAHRASTSLDPDAARRDPERVRSAAATNSTRSSRCSTSAPPAVARWWWRWRRRGR